MTYGEDFVCMQWVLRMKKMGFWRMQWRRWCLSYKDESDDEDEVEESMMDLGC